MPARKRPALSPGEHAALTAGLRALGEYERRAMLDKYVAIADAYDAGMTVEAIGAIFGKTGTTAQRWKNAGCEERRRRASGGQRPMSSDPDVSVSR